MGLRVYTVHLPSFLSGDSTPVLVKEGFSWGAFFLGMIWALWHRLWIEAAALLALFLAVGVISDFIALSEPVESVVLLAIAVLVGCSGNDWRRESLRQRGYREAGVVAGRGAEDALWRYLDLRALDARKTPAASTLFQEPAALYAAPVPHQTPSAFAAVPPPPAAAPASDAGGSIAGWYAGSHQPPTAPERVPVPPKDQQVENSPGGGGYDHPDNALRDYRPRR